MSGSTVSDAIQLDTAGAVNAVLNGQGFDPAVPLRQSLGVAVQGNPQREADLQRAARTLGISPLAARQAPDDTMRAAQVQALKADQLVQQFPRTAAWLLDHDNARLAADDVHAVTQVESAVRAMGKPGLPRADERTLLQRVGSSDFWVGAAKYLASANDNDNNLLSDMGGAAVTVNAKIGQVGGLVLGALGGVSDATGLTSGAQDAAFGLTKFYSDKIDAENSKPKDFHNELVRTATSLGLQLPLILATGGNAAVPEASAGVMQALGQATAHGIKGMTVPAVTDAVQTMRQVYAQTGDMEAATRAAQVQYLNSSASGVIPLNAPGALLNRLITGAGVGVVQGEASRNVQNMAMPDDMQTAFRWEDVLLNAVTSALMAGAMGPRAEPQRAAAVRAFNEAYEVARAEQASQQVVGLAEAANASKLRERDPQAFKQLVADMADRGDLPPVLHVDAGRLEQVLAEAGVTGDELAQTMPRVAEQLDQLREAGGPRNVPVEIPVEDFATHIAGSELEKQLMAEMRVTPEGRTVAEAEAFRQDQQADLQTRAERLTEQHTQDVAYQDSLARMNEQVDTQLAGLQMRPDQFDANTTLLRAFYQVQADRIGIAPHEFAERYPLHGTNKALAGDNLEQAPIGGARGTYSPSTKTIALLKGANLSTFQHELGHFFLDTITHMAAMPDAPAEVVGDAYKLLTWGGVEDLTDWHSRTVDQQRELHEKFATGWETYLMQGQAPSTELRALFARFRAWMLAVYKKLKDAPGEFTPEVRGVMDRMIASEDAIREAELARRYMPLFDNPEQAGMTAEQWAAYQAQGKDATELAIEQLTGKTLRDMARIDRLRAASLKAIEKDAAVKFKTIEREVRAEVMSQPVYMAWAYLRADLKAENVSEAGGARLESSAAKAIDPEAAKVLQARKMTSPEGIHPDLVAEMFGFGSGHELALALLAADHPREVIRGMAEQRMIERHGEIATPQAMAREADLAVANEVRAQFVASELRALKQATGAPREIAKAAKEVALQMVDAQRVRDIRGGRYSAASARAAREAEKMMAKGDPQGAAMAKRDQLLNLELARASREARDYVAKSIDYLKRFDSDQIRKSVDPEYVDQIEALLERFDLRSSTTGKEIDRRASLAEWLKAQEAMGLEPDLPQHVLAEATRVSYKTLTLAEMKGLVDSVKQIEHLGKLKSKLLTAADQRAYEAVRDEMASSIVNNAGDRTADTRTPTTNLGLALQALRAFGAAHIKAATWARILDGGKDGGAVWEYLIRPANAAGDKEVQMRAAATKALHEIMAPLFKGEKMGGKGRFFPSIKRSLNRQERLAIALNTGNDGNLQRLLGGEGWTREQIQPVLDAITPEEARAVQAIWDHFETYRPLVGEMEKRIYGKEPDWVQPVPIKLGSEELRGGYYPVKYDPAASVRAEEHADAEGARRQLQGAYGAATVRRSFAKARAEEVKGRPLMYSLSGVYQGINETIHALAWSEWLIDANRLLKSTAIDRAVREHYGPEAVRQFKTWRDAVAEGEQAVNGAMDKALGAVRQSVSVAGLGFNVMSAAMQPLGFSQSVVRLGAQWAGKGLGHYLASPREASAKANELSDFMASRSRTRFRELNELRNQVQDQSAAKTAMQQGAYWMMMKCQQMVDVPTWWGGYEKAIAEGNTEARAIALADQAVIDSQGGGQTKDLSAIEMGGQAQKLFTVFYSFMNTALNLGVASTMTPKTKARMAADYLLLYTVPAVLGAMWKDALTPGDSGDYDDPAEAAKKLGSEQLGFLMGLFAFVREFTEAGKAMAGLSDRPHDYSGPTGVRPISDSFALAKQAQQGEFDTAFRKALVNILGDTMGLPSAQINRTITGAEALRDGKTQNPLALAFGYQEER